MKPSQWGQISPSFLALLATRVSARSLPAGGHVH